MGKALEFADTDETSGKAGGVRAVGGISGQRRVNLYDRIYYLMRRRVYDLVKELRRNI